MSTGRSLLAPDERLMPSYKVPADRQLAVIRAACSSSVPVGAAQLAEITGLPAKKCGLVPIFALNTGLLTRAHRYAMYLPSDKGRAIARAFNDSHEAGLAALRKRWRGQWFGRAMRERLGHGPVTRDGLVAKLLLSARADQSRIRQAQVLLDLLVAVGLIVPESGGLLSWYEGAYYRSTGPSATHTAAGSPEESESRSRPQDTLFNDGSSGPGVRSNEPDEPAPDPTSETRSDRDEPVAGRVPPPRDSTTAQQSGKEDLLALLLPPVLLADLTRLSPEEVLELHGHLRAVAGLTAKLRGRPVA